MYNSILSLPGVKELPKNSVTILKINRYHEKAQGHTCLMFKSGYPYPQYVVKSGKNPLFHQLLKTEYENLQLLQTIQDNRFKQTTPKGVYLGYIGNCCYLVQTGLPGIPMKSLVSKDFLNLDKSTSLFSTITQWIIDFGNLLPPNHNKDNNQLLFSLVNKPIEKFCKCFKINDHESRSISKIAEMVADYLLNNSNRLFFTHDDFCTSNILVLKRSKQIGVIDWEAKMEPRLPLLDMLHFFTCLAENLSKNSMKNVNEYFKWLQYFFFQRTPFSDIIVQQVEKVTNEFHIPGQVILPIYFMYWIYNSLEKYEYFKVKLEQTSGNTPVQKEIWKVMEKEVRPYSNCRVVNGKVLNIEFLVKHGHEFIFPWGG